MCSFTCLNICFYCGYSIRITGNIQNKIETILVFWAFINALDIEFFVNSFIHILILSQTLSRWRVGFPSRLPNTKINFAEINPPPFTVNHPCPFSAIEVRDAQMIQPDAMTSPPPIEYSSIEQGQGWIRQPTSAFRAGCISPILDSLG